jgi:cytoskeletal protein CcmA (bactofilin family)
VGENLDVTSNLTVSGDATMSGNATMSGDAMVSGDATVSGNVEMSSNLTVSGNVELSRNLTVSGDATVSGNVGVGTTEPTESLDIVGNLNLQKVSNTTSIKLNSNVVTEYTRSKKFIKYPRETLTSASQNGYVVTASRDVPGTYDKWEAFNNLKGGSSNDVGWHTSTGSIAQYTGTNNIYSGTEQLSTETDSGEWIAIELPISIKLIETHIWSQYNYAHLPKGGVFYAKNDASDTWTELYRYTGNVIASRNAPNIYQIDANEYFKYFAFVVTHRSASGEGISIGEWELYGIPEYDPEAHGTDVIMRSVPNVPNTDWLEVYYDAKGLSDGSISTVNDLKPSGTALNGTVVGDVAVSDGVFTFDGSGDYIYNSQSSHTDSGGYTASVWVKWDENASGSTSPCIFQYGNGSNYKSFGITSPTTSTKLRAYVYGATSVDIELRENGKWTHLLATYKAESSTIHFYVDGALIQSGTNANNMSLDGSPYLTLGVQTSGSNDSTISSTYFKGSIANFRLFNRVLSEEEAWQLYAYQKDHFQLSPDVMTLKNGALGVGTLEPKAMLDVRGGAYFSNPINIDGTVVSSFTGKHMCFPDGPMDKGLIVSANKNKYVTLNGSVVTGLEAIKSDESLPLVSLSNTASDVSVFGVVHDIETGGTTRTNETGGKTRKPLGDNRVIVNSLGEGAMWVANTNGNLVSGDYITTSNVAGYGQRQDDDILHNYTVAKITMDCDFNPQEVPVQVIKEELDSYGRIQWEDHPTETEKAYKIRYLDATGVQTDEANAIHTAAFVGCTYHCG